MKIDIEESYKKYAPMVFRRCLSLLKNKDEALDAAQDVFVNLLRYNNQLHGKFLSSLLYTIATNICLNLLRQRKLQSSSIESQTLPLSAHDPQFEKVEDGVLMDAILHNESESTRAICFMYHGDGMTLREIGEIMSLSISGVRKRLLSFNARAKLKLEGERS
ncbi:MAG: sigma-70 family RNA polymerase sigma factor [Spirochaetaceae bacterium]|nr:sigma-70 family RNA polymerase sigma factor [Spirochaetaceae bacterium]